MGEAFFLRNGYIWWYIIARSWLGLKGVDREREREVRTTNSTLDYRSWLFKSHRVVNCNVKGFESSQLLIRVYHIFSLIYWFFTKLNQRLQQVELTEYVCVFFYIKKYNSNKFLSVIKYARATKEGIANKLKKKWIVVNNIYAIFFIHTSIHSKSFNDSSIHIVKDMHCVKIDRVCFKNEIWEQKVFADSKVEYFTGGWNFLLSGWKNALFSPPSLFFMSNLLSLFSSYLTSRGTCIQCVLYIIIQCRPSGEASLQKGNRIGWVRYLRCFH